MPSTTRLQIPYPAASDPPNGPAQMQAIAEALDNAAIDLAEGTLSARPVPSKRGRWYYATDAQTLYRDSGSTWRAVTLQDNDVTTARIADSAVTNAKVAAAAAITRSKLDFGAGLSNADIAAAAAIAESKLALASDAAAGTASRRSLGSGATQAAPGNDSRFPAGADIVNADIAASAGIVLSKLGTGALAFLNAVRTADETDVDANETHTYISFVSPALPFAGTIHAFVFQHGLDTRGGAGDMFPNIMINGGAMPSGIGFSISGGKRASVSLYQKATGRSAGETPTLAFQVGIANTPVRWQPQGHTMLIALLEKT